MSLDLGSIRRQADRLRASAGYHTLRGTLAGVADLLLPRVCVACERPLAATQRGIICGFCWTRLDTIPYPQCARCGHPHIRHSCRWCNLLPPFVRAVRSVCWVPGGAGGQIVHALKYDGRRSLAVPLAALMRERGTDVLAGATAAVPVPLHPSRQRARGFNQAADLAKHLGLPVVRALRRTRPTAVQAELPAAQRHLNVTGAFTVTRQARDLRGVIVVVDDVSTTGATLDACACALKQAGAREVRALTAARVSTARR